MTREQYELRKLAEQRRIFLETIQPLVRVKLDIYASCVPSITYFSDAQYPVVQYPEWVLDAAGKVDAIIEQIAQSFAAKQPSEGK